MNNYFKSFTEIFPPSKHLIYPAEAIIKRYENHLPNDLLSMWKENGFGNYGGGLVKVINPLDYADVPGINRTTDIPLLVDSFGDIFVYRNIPENNLKAVGIINVHYRNREFFIIGEDCIEQLFGNMSPMMPIIRLELFNEAVEIHGELGTNEIFFFVPALAAGGEEDIKYVDKGNAFVHYSLLAQMLGVNFSAKF